MMSPGNTTILAIAVVMAIAVSLFVWFAIDLGSTAVARYRANFNEQAQFQIQEFFLFIDAEKLFLANLLLMTIGGLFTWSITGSIVLAIPVFLGLLLAPRLLYAVMRAKRLQRFESQLPDALMMMAGGMRAGASLSSAIAQLVAETPAPLGQEFSLMLREQKLGVTTEQSLTNLARRMPTQTTSLVVSAMRIAAETGGGLAETLERTAVTMRSRMQMEGKIAALTAQGKLQAWVVGGLPIGLMIVLNYMEPQAMDMLWHTRVGWATLAVLFILEFMGIFVIRRIIAIDV